MSAIRQPFACICVPCYNNEATIGETLQSLVKQNYSNFVIKVFDNASTDNSRAVVNQFKAQYQNIELFTRETTISGEENFNYCIQHAEGDYSAIFHSDDVYHPDMIARQVAFLELRPGCGAVSTHACVINEKSKFVGERFVPIELKSNTEHELSDFDLSNLVFKYGNFITCPSVMFRTEILKGHVKEFRGSDFKSSADLNVWLRVAEKASFGFINEPLINYRQSSASFSFNLSRVRIHDHDMFLVLDDYLEQLPEGVEKTRLKKSRDFLLMKDRANTNLNRLILGADDYQPLGVFSNFQQVVSSFFHAKYFFIALAVKLLINTPYHKSIFVRFIKRVKFGNV